MKPFSACSFSKFTPSWSKPCSPWPRANMPSPCTTSMKTLTARASATTAAACPKKAIAVHAANAPRSKFCSPGQLHRQLDLCIVNALETCSHIRRRNPMANLNKVMLIGRLTRDPEMRSFSNGGKVAKFGFAVNNRKKNSATGQWENDPVFLDVEAFNRGD